MGVVRLPDELQRVIKRQVAECRAATPAEFLEEAVMRLVEEFSAEDVALDEAVEAGSADIASGRYTTVSSPEDSRRLLERLTATLEAHLAPER